MRQKPFVLFFLVLWIFSSCSTSYHYADFIKPSEIYVPANIFAVGIINRAAGPSNSAPIYEGSVPFEFVAGLPEEMAEQTLVKLQEEVLTLKRFELRQIPWDLRERNDRSFTLPPLTEQAIDSICELYNLDGLIVLEGLELNIRTSGRVYMVTGTNANGAPVNSPEFSGNQEVSLTVSWNFYSGYALKTIDTYQNNYQRVFGGAEVGGPKGKEKYSFFDIARTAAEDYFTRIAPHWENDHRLYYSSGTEALSRISYELNYSGDWDVAAESWKNLAYQSKFAKERYMASYNMALASEMIGKPKIAKDWLLKAQKISPTKEVEKYMVIIDRQILIYDVVSSQLGL